MMEFTVLGVPAPAGSKRGFAVKGRVIITDANKKAAPWKALVSAAAREVYDGPLLTGPLAVRMMFYFPRPKGHYGTGKNAGKLKASAPAEHTKKPDALKLSRGTEDALTGIVWRDDSQIVCETLSKHYGEPARAEIIIQPYETITQEPPDV